MGEHLKHEISKGKNMRGNRVLERFNLLEILTLSKQGNCFTRFTFQRPNLIVGKTIFFLI